MAQFDYFPRGGATGYWLNCQTDYLSDLPSCFVVPLIPMASAPKAIRMLNPVFDIGGEQFFMLTEQAGPIPASELRQPSGSLESYRHIITNALDFLITAV